MSFTCDNCGLEVTEGMLVSKVVVRVPRPSDPTDLCGVLWFCTSCQGWEPIFPQEFGDGGQATEAQWQHWMEEQGQNLGYMWLT